MKITHIASGDLWAGAEKQLYVLLTALSELPDVVVDAIILNPGPLSERLQRAGIRVVQLNERTTGPVRLFQQIRGHLRQAKPDVVHTHRIKENILGGLAARTTGIPSVRTQHGAEEHTGQRLSARQAVLDFADRVDGRMVQSRIVGVSEQVGAMLRDRFPADRVSVIENGIDLSQINSQSTTDDRWTDSKRWTIGIAGRLVALKRVDMFIDAASWIAAHMPSADMRFRIVGDGPLRETLEAQRAASPNNANIEFLGHVDNAEEIVGGLHALVICSDHEGLPMVALEAMRNGTPVVTWNLGGLTSLIQDGECGVLVPEHSAEAFARAIVDLASSPNRASAISAAARKRIENDYSAKRMAVQYADVYRACIAPVKRS